MTSGIEHSRYQESLPTSQRAHCTLRVRVSDLFSKPQGKATAGANLYLMATSANYIKRPQHLSVSYQAHKRHSPYSFCLPLEYKALWYRAYFEGSLDLFAKALLCLDDPCMQVIFSCNKLGGNVQSTFRIVPTLPIRT